MTRPVTKLWQNMIDGEYSLAQIHVTTIEDVELAHEPELLDVFDHPRPLGLSPGYDTRDCLVALAIADDKNCYIVEFPPPKFDRKQNARKPLSKEAEQGRAILQERILCRTTGDRYAFDMAPLSMSLSSINLRVVNAIDIQSAYSPVDRKPLTAIREAIGDTVKIIEENILDVFRNPVYDKTNRNRFTDLGLRAWVSQFLAGYGNAEVTFANAKRIDTLNLTSEKISMISKVTQDRLRLDLIKPGEKTHRGVATRFDSNGKVDLLSPSFSNRFRGNENVRIRMNGQNGEVVQRGRIAGTAKRAGSVATDRDFSSITSVDVRVIGRDDPTTAEARRDATLLRVLQGEYNLLNDSPWTQNVWFPTPDGRFIWPEDWAKEAIVQPPSSPPTFPSEIEDNLARLNTSQQRAINTMISSDDSHRLVLIQGPPGTGKTSVIAAFVQMVDIMGYRGIWLVAKSNVAVKNIAEKLLSVNFTSWRLIVSRDFKDGWAVLPIIPLNTLIVDEASQIEIGSYIPIFSDMKTLRKYLLMGKKICRICKELKTSTGSYMNDEEKMVAIQIAQHLQNSGKKYKIITPYEGQTTAIQNEMKETEDLDWGDKCFNVDSFQGNEEDYIIISLVRSRELGFLPSLRRTNVMLTRCKKGMFIVTSEDFLLGAGADSLVGQLVHNIPREGLISVADVKDGKFLKDLERKTLKVKKAQD
ncbi:P-loop containing nucleoside triphosphate hydrolase protein [Cyathus striatus]|nr:P-loop containing nucleoside triphosphate hydrolase protein [Cyathus striatus]